MNLIEDLLLHRPREVNARDLGHESRSELLHLNMLVLCIRRCRVRHIESIQRASILTVS